MAVFTSTVCVSSLTVGEMKLTFSVATVTPDSSRIRTVRPGFSFGPS